jgi:dinuclear metal center YbgI/SA1388 family protein
MNNTIQEVIAYLEGIAPLCYQESYDNSGLLVGNPNAELKKGLICLDVTQAVMEEAIATGCNLIISHHPLIFNPLKKITGATWCEKLLVQAIKNDIVIYAVHTNLDNIQCGVNQRFAEKLGLKNTRILQPTQHNLYKLATYIPNNYAETVRNALFAAGAGTIGDYNSCSYNTEGFGTFQATENANPFVGKKNEVHKEKEIRTEVIFPVHLKTQIIRALIQNHPYEEPAFDLIPIANTNPSVGAGMIGDLETAMNEAEFLLFLKKQLQLSCLKHSKMSGKKIKTVALCGGSGGFLIGEAMKQKADIFISSELKHNHFIEHAEAILLTDIGHFESEIQTKFLLYEFLIKKFSTFAVSVNEKNPILYL